MTEALKVLKRFIYVYFFALLVAPLGYGLRILYAKGLSVEEYGVFYAIIALLSVLLIFSDFGFSQALVYFIPKFRKNHKQCKALTIYAVSVHSITALIFGLGLFFLSPFLAEYYFKTPIAELPLKVLAFYFAIWTVGRSLISSFKGFQLERYWAPWELFRLAPALLLSALVMYYMQEDRLFWISLIWLITLVIRFIWYLVVLLKKFSFLVRVAATGAGALMGNVDVIILTYLQTVTETALYNIALPSAHIVMVLIMPLTESMLSPKICV